MLETESKTSGRNSAYTPIRFTAKGLLFVIGCSDGLVNVTMYVRGLTVKIRKYTHIQEKVITDVWTAVTWLCASALFSSSAICCHWTDGAAIS